MAKYKPGSFEKCINDLIADYFEEILNAAKALEPQGEEDEEGKKQRGRVKDPEHDKRLKDNR